jgi:hypothetical protein
VSALRELWAAWAQISSAQAEWLASPVAAVDVAAMEHVRPAAAWAEQLC